MDSTTAKFDRTLRHVIVGLLMTAGAVIGLACSAVAAEPDTPRKVLLMVVRDTSTSKKEYIEKKLTAVVKESGCGAGRIVAEEISKATFDDLERILVSGRLPPEARGGLQLEPYVGGEGAQWVIDLGHPRRFLERLVVSVGETKYVYLRKPSGNERKFEFHSPGRYTFELPEKEALDSFTVEFTNEQNAKRTENGTLPPPSRHWLVRFDDFRGDEQLLFTTMLDPVKFPNPVPPNVQKGPAVTVALADLNPVGVEEGLIWSGNAFTIRFPTLPGRQPKKVWMMFPLNPDQVNDQKNKFKGFDEYQLPIEIDQNKIAAGEKAPMISPDMKPQWFEIPWNQEKRVFERTFTVDVAKWRKQDQLTVFRLHVYEHVSPTGSRAAILLRDRRTGSQGFVLAAEETEWPTGILASGRESRSDK